MIPTNRHSITIVPFKQLSTEADHTALIEELMDDFCRELSKFQEFEVTLLPEGESFDSVNYTLSGSLLKSLSTTRISYKVTYGTSKKVIFGHRLEESSEGLLSRWESIVLKIVYSIRDQIGKDQLVTSHYFDSKSIQVHHLYLKGLSELNKGNHEADVTARDYFLKALRIDPNFSQAHSGLGNTYLNEWSYHFWVNSEDHLNKASALANRALELNDRNYEALTLLSKYYLYRGDLNKAESNLKKALLVNDIDAENLACHALTLYLLGKNQEANQLIQKAISINPSLDGWHHNTFALICYALGEYDESLALSNQIEPSKSFIYLPCLIRAAEFNLGLPPSNEDFESEFLDQYRKKVANDLNATITGAYGWLDKLLKNTKGKQLMSFVWGNQHKSLKPSQTPQAPIHQKLYKYPDYWKFVFNDIEVVVPVMKGIEDISMLLTAPDTKLHCSELMGVNLEERSVDMVDEKAKRQYRKKLQDLQEQIDDAESFQDYEQMERLRNEYEELQSFITKSLKINGQSRKANNINEKARSAITWRIRNSISKISEINESLAKHLKSSIKTGNYCYYSPEIPQSWDLIKEPSEQAV